VFFDEVLNKRDAMNLGQAAPVAGRELSSR
jgi:hypothetical protein